MKLITKLLSVFLAVVFAIGSIPALAMTVFNKTSGLVACAAEIAVNKNDSKKEAGQRSFTVYYHSSVKASASGSTTKVIYGTPTKTLTVSALDFEKTGYTFAGWRCYREYDGKWLTRDPDGNQKWLDLTDGLPSGYSYNIYGNGAKIAKTAPSGKVHFYAQWKINTYTVYYHSSNAASASGLTTTVSYGTSTRSLTVSALGFEKTGYTFAGWRCYREYDGKWLTRDPDGNQEWLDLSDGMPSGYSYNIYGNGAKIAKTAPSGKVHFYAQWKANTYTVYYHSSNTASASGSTTKVIYGTPTRTLAVSSLDFEKTGYTFAGWRCYREYDGKWLTRDPDGNQKWLDLSDGMPSGYSYNIYGNGVKIAKTAPSGKVHFYAQFKANTFTVYYHIWDFDCRMTTTVTYGNPTRLYSIYAIDKPYWLDYEDYDSIYSRFEGWRCYREYDEKWALKDSSGNFKWGKLKDNWELPDGYSFYIYDDMANVSKTAPSGDVHLYAWWGQDWDEDVYWD